MRLLLIVDDATDARAVVDYVVWRFGARALAVDVLRVLPPGAPAPLPGPRRRCPVVPSPATGDAAGETARRLRAVPGARVRTTNLHLRHGGAARAIADIGARLGSDLILIERPAGPTRSGLRRVALLRRLLADTRCAVECFAPAVARRAAPLEMLVALALEDIVRFPVTRLCDFGWPGPARLRVLALPSGRASDGASSGAGLRCLPSGHVEPAAAQRAAAGRLGAFAAELGRVLGEAVEVRAAHAADASRTVPVDAAGAAPSLVMVLADGLRGRAPRAADGVPAPWRDTSASLLYLHGDAGDLALREWLATTVCPRQARRAGPAPR